MSAPSTTPSTTFESSAAWYGGRKAIRYRQRVNCTDGALQIPLGFNVPAYGRVVGLHMRNVANATVGGSAAGANADGIALAMVIASAATATAAVTAIPVTATIKAAVGTVGNTSGFVIGVIGTGTTESNGVYRGVPLLTRINTNAPAAIAENPFSTEAYLALVAAQISGGSIAVNSTSTNAGYNFGTAGAATATNTKAQVDVTLYVETYADYPS